MGAVVRSRAVKAGLAMTGVPNAQQVSAFRAFRTELRDGFAHVVDPFFSLDVVLSWTTTSVVRRPGANGSVARSGGRPTR